MDGAVSRARAELIAGVGLDEWSPQLLDHHFILKDAAPVVGACRRGDEDLAEVLGQIVVHRTASSAGLGHEGISGVGTFGGPFQIPAHVNFFHQFVCHCRR